MKFAPIALPKTAVRCSWLLRKADTHCNKFARILAKLDHTFPIDYSKGKLSAYYSLLRYLSTQFPTFEPCIEDPEDGSQSDAMSEADEFGIPVEFYGRDYDMRDGDAAHAAYSAVEWFMADDRKRDNHYYGNDIEHHAGIAKIASHVRPFETQYFHLPSLHLKRGWKWVEPWNGLPDLVRYCTSETGLWFLDHSNLDVMEAGGFYPRWDLGEIKAIVREWKRAKPVWDRINALADHIDAQPEIGVPLMLRVLSGEAEAKLLVTARKPTKPRTRKVARQTRPNLTLAEVFCGQA